MTYSNAFGNFSIVIGDIGSLLAVLGFGSLFGLYFWEKPLPRARIAALSELLDDIRESGDFVGQPADTNQLSYFDILVQNGACKMLTTLELGLATSN
jgi:hypothetical protein